MPGYFNRSRFSHRSRLNFNWLLHATVVTGCFIYHNALAQDATIDSLKDVLPGLTERARIDCLNRISLAYTKFLQVSPGYQQTDSARIYASIALQEAQTSQYYQGVARANENLGELEAEGGRFNKAEPFLKQSLELYDSLKQLADLNWVRITLGWVLSEQGKFTEAREILQKAAGYYKSASNVMLESRIYRMIGNSYAHQGYFMKAFEYTQKAYVMGRKPGDTFGNLFSPDKKGDLFFITGDTATALTYYEESAAYAKFHGHERFYLLMMGEIHFLKRQYDSALLVYYKYAEYAYENHKDEAIRGYHLATVQSKLGKIYLILGRTYEGLRVLQKAAFHFRSTNDVNALLTVLYDIASAYDKQLNNLEALAVAKEMITLGEKAEKRKFVMDGYWFAWRAYDRTNNLSLAYDAHVKYSRLKDQIESDQYKQKIAVADWIEKERQLETEVNILNRDNEVKQDQLKTEMLVKKILMGGLVGFMLLGAIIFRNLSLKRKNEKLQSEKKETALEKRATELEMQTLRTQMSPHFIFNSLNSINHFIMQSDNVQASEYLGKFSRLIRLILQNSRSPFIPLENELEALQLYLELEVVRFNHHFKFNITLEDSIDPSVVKVPPIIIQPFAENAIWHGLMQKEDNGNLNIRIFEREGELFCEIADDGIGREKAREIKNKSSLTHKSMGMKITAERLALLQKKGLSEENIRITDLVLADGRPGGTEVVIKIPVQYD